jgi:hypothetical protein
MNITNKTPGTVKMIKYHLENIIINIRTFTLVIRKSLACPKHHKVHSPTSANSRSAVSNTSLSNKPYKIKPMIILHGTICIMHTTIFPGQENDFLPLRTVSMLNLPENAHFDILKVISKRVESTADKFSNYVPNTFKKRS